MLTLSPCNCKHLSYPQTKECHEKREALGTDFKKDVPLPQPFFECQLTDQVGVNARGKKSRNEKLKRERENQKNGPKR